MIMRSYRKEHKVKDKINWLPLDRQKCLCRKCGWRWTSRKYGRPSECPECKARDWDGTSWRDRIEVQ